MSHAIVVGSYRKSPWLQGCLDSIPSRFPTIVVRNGGYECGCLRWVMENTTLDEFFFLQDSTCIKKSEWLDDVFAMVGTSIAVNAEPVWGGSFLAKYRREILRHITIPVTNDKMSAVVAEASLGPAYAKLEPGVKILWPGFTLQNATPGFVHGRSVMIYENDHFVKYKSAWGMESVGVCDERDKAHRAIYDIS